MPVDLDRDFGIDKGHDMSRTLKDRKWKLKFPELDYRFDSVKITSDNSYSIRYIQLPGVKTKKKRELDTDWHWLNSTPSWWTRLTMNRPQRRAGRVWEHKVLKEQDLEDCDPPLVGHKPHIYYY
jgi:hypothetical protein